MVAFVKHIMDMATGFCVTQTPPTLLLLLSKLCLELEGSTVNFLVRNAVIILVYVHSIFIIAEPNR